MEAEDNTAWYFSNSSDPKTKIKVIGNDSAKHLVALLSNEQATTWHIRKEGGRQELVFHNTYFAKAPRDAASDIRVVRDNRQAIEKRKHIRVPAKLKVLIIKGSERFESTSIDISIGGIYLNSAVPENFLFHICICKFIDPDRNLEFSMEARILKASPDRCRIIFDGVPFKVREALSVWIDQHMKVYAWRAG